MKRKQEGPICAWVCGQKYRLNMSKEIKSYTAHTHTHRVTPCSLRGPAQMYNVLISGEVSTRPGGLSADHSGLQGRGRGDRGRRKTRMGSDQCTLK